MQGFAHRATADVHLSGNCRLSQLCAGRQFANDDCPSEMFCNCVGKGVLGDWA
jgi:hypothetical protein